MMDEDEDLSCLLGGTFLSTKILLDNRLYASVSDNSGNGSTYVYGCAVQGNVGDYFISQFRLSDKYFDGIFPCVIDHALFVDGLGVYLDYYASYEIPTDVDDAEEKIYQPTTAELTSIYGFEQSESLVNIDSI